jgi:hypothetical protein
MEHDRLTAQHALEPAPNHRRSFLTATRVVLRDAAQQHRSFEKTSGNLH